MTLLFPWYLAAGAVVAAALVALHLLAVGRPPELLLPTARFVPERPARAVSRAPRPTDLLLLAVRALAALLAALALARPTRVPERRPVARVVLADRSRAADPAAVRAALDSLARPGDAIVAFDSTAASPVAVPADAAARAASLDAALAGARGEATAAVTVGSAPRGGLSAALAAARRHAPSLAAAADSLELVIVSPLPATHLDAATGALRGEWPGRARVVRVAARTGGDSAPPRSAGVELVWRRTGMARDDALAAALALAGVAPGAARGGSDGVAPSVRVVRDGVTAADLAWAREPGRTLVDWPHAGAPRGWTARPAADTAAAVVAGDVAVVAPFPRGAEPARDAPGGPVVARWADGAPAATERAEGAGCVRAVAVAVPGTGDVALGQPFLRLAARLARPCGAAAATAPAGATTVRELEGEGALLATRSFRRPIGTPDGDRLPAWLLAAAIALLLVELPLRRLAARRAGRADALATDGDPVARAA